MASGWPPAGMGPGPGQGDWAGPLTGWTLRVGAPGDDDAGRPRLTVQDASKYLSRQDRGPDQVVVYWPVDGPAWAKELGLPVYAPEGELDAEGRMWLKDESGIRYQSPVTLIISTAAGPGGMGVVIRCMSWRSGRRICSGRGRRRRGASRRIRCWIAYRWRWGGSGRTSADWPTGPPWWTSRLTSAAWRSWTGRG